MGFTLQSIPFREMLGSSRSRIPSCRYPSPSAVRGRSCLFPGRQDRTSRLQGFDPSRSPFAGAWGLAEASGRCSPGFMPLQGVLPDVGTLTLRERASHEVPAWVLGTGRYPCGLQLVRLVPRLPECRPIPSFLAVLGMRRLTCMGELFFLEFLAILQKSRACPRIRTLGPLQRIDPASDGWSLPRLPSLLRFFSSSGLAYSRK